MLSQTLGLENIERGQACCQMKNNQKLPEELANWEWEKKGALPSICVNDAGNVRVVA